MAIRSRDFIGIAEGIKSHELSAMSRVERLQDSISELSRTKRSLERKISDLEAALEAAYEDTDEDGECDWDRIAALEAQIENAANRLFDIEQDLDDTEDSLAGSRAEVERVMEEKEKTLFEIQERARKTSQNISIAGGMYGAYSGVGSSLQNSMQTSLAALTRAASILGGSVDGGILSGSAGGKGSGGEGSSGGFSSGDAATSAVCAFTIGNFSAASGGNLVSSPNQFYTSQTNAGSPASISGFESSQQSMSSEQTLNFISDQSGNESMPAAFSAADDVVSAASSEQYASAQISQGAELCFAQDDSTDREKNPKILIPMTDKSFKEMEESFQDGQYQKVVLSQDTILYRYFGSVPDGAGVSEGTIESGRGWGSDAGGQYLTRDGNLTSAQAKELLALNPDWGNSILYRATIVVPAGTEVFIGIAKKQVSESGEIVSGGGEQIVLNGYWTTEMNSWIKGCQAVDSSKMDKEYIGVDPAGAEFFKESHNSVNEKQTTASIIDFAINYIKNSSSSMVQAWTQQLDVFSQKLKEIYSSRYSSYISPEKLDVPLSKTVLYETQELFCSRGYNKKVLGYNDGVCSHIAVGTGHELQTTVHENLHQLSNNNGQQGIIVKYGKTCKNEQLNEAITELVTKRTLGSAYGPEYSAYADNRNAMELLESVMGEDIICRAYFQNQPQLMEDLFDNVLGVGSWQQLSEAFDDCVSEHQFTRQIGKVRRDDLIKRYVCATNNNEGGSDDWTNLLL